MATEEGQDAATEQAGDRGGALERFVYDDRIVRAFLSVTMLWSVVAILVGILIALQLAAPKFNLGLSFTSFGRLRPLHTNAAVFAFAGNAIFAAIYHSTQRLCKARMFSDFLSWFHFWGWQLIIVAAALSLPPVTRRARSTRNWSGPSTWRLPLCGSCLLSTSSARCFDVASDTCMCHSGSISPRS